MHKIVIILLFIGQNICLACSQVHIRELFVHKIVIIFLFVGQNIC